MSGGKVLVSTEPVLARRVIAPDGSFSHSVSGLHSRLRTGLQNGLKRLIPQRTFRARSPRASAPASAESIPGIFRRGNGGPKTLVICPLEESEFEPRVFSMPQLPKSLNSRDPQEMYPNDHNGVLCIEVQQGFRTQKNPIETF